jgi:subtilisin family serine protease
VRRIVLIGVLLLGFAAIASAEPPVPDDPGWEFQRDYMPLVHVPEVWEQTTGDPAIVIAVVDTGINASLIDLVDNVVPGWNFVDNNADTSDFNGHGTLVATEMGALGNNGEAIAGYCWHCKLMPVRVSSNGKADDTMIAAGIRWAADHGAKVINVSFAVDGSAGVDGPVASAVAYAQAKGSLVVAAAGNGGNTTPTYPAAIPGVLSVTGTTADGSALASWASRGNWVQLAAPGCQIVQVPSTMYGEICGSSVTSPVVAGIAGLLFSVNPNLSPQQVALALRSSAHPLPGIAGGLVDAYAALGALGLAAPPKPAVAADAGQRLARVFSGSVRGHRTLTLRLVKGRADLTLDMPDVRGCSMSLTSSSTSVLALPFSRFEIRMSVRVETDRYRLNITCTGKKARVYTLGVAGVFPTAQPASQP